MKCRIPFADISNCIKGGVTLREVIIESRGTIAGDPGGTVAGTQLAHFTSSSAPTAFLLTDDTGGGANNVVPAFVGTFPGSVEVDLDILTEDINVRYRVTDPCGVSDFYQVLVTLFCTQPTGSLSVTVNIMEEGHYHWNLGLDVEADYIKFEVRKSIDMSLLGEATVQVGDNVLTTVSDDTNWLNTGANDGNIATYLTAVTGAVLTEVDLLGAGWTIDFDKMQFMVDRGLVDGEGGDTELLLTITPGNNGCVEPLTAYTDTIPEGIFADVMIPFVGKQGALPYPEIEWDNTAPNCSLAHGGFSMRNGSYSAQIEEIRIDLFDDASDEVTANSGASVLFPLPPLTSLDAAANSCGPVNPSPYVGFDLSDALDDNVSDITGTPPNLDGYIYNDFKIELDYNIGITDRTTIVKGIIGHSVSSADNGATWTFDVTGNFILIARGDAMVYGTSTTGTIGAITFWFNVNASDMGGAGGASSWVTEEVRVADTPGLAPGSFTTYGSIMSGNGVPTPPSGSSVTNIPINHVFASPGTYKVEIEIETDNGYSSLSEFWVSITKY